VVDGLRAFWGDTRGDFVVTVLAMPATHDGLVGIGRDGGFMALIPADVSPRKIAWLATHEYTHAWIPMRTGRMPAGDAEPSAYWFSEGFTVFYTDRLGLRDRRATLQAFLDDFNAGSVGYDMSPVRRAPNARIVRDFWSDPDVQRLPYVRGAVLAYLLDARLRDRTAGRHSLDDVMHRMRDRFRSDPQLGVRENLVHSYAELGGGDIRDWLLRYIDRGEQMLLPDDLFGGCLTVLREQKPGFGLVQSAAIVPGLSPQRQAACLRRLGGG
jgi:predicted metalloprotease with PDZ domain